MSKDLSLVLKTSLPLDNTSQPVTFSPVTALTMSFSDLINEGFTGTPKTRVCFDDAEDVTPTVVSRSLKPLALSKELSEDTDCQESCTSPDPSCQLKKGSSLEIRSAAFRRFKSLPRPFNDLDNSPLKSLLSSPSSSPRSFGSECLSHNVPSSPSGEKCHPSTVSTENNRFSLHEDEDSSQDSGLGLDKAQSPFAKPHAPAPRPLVARSRILSDSTNIISSVSPKRLRSPTPDFTQHFRSNPLKENSSPTKLRKSSLTCSPETDEGDDGFLDLSEGDEGDIPKGLEGLLRNPVFPAGYSGCSKYNQLEDASEFTPGLSTYNQENIRTKKSASRRGLFRSPSTPARISDQCSPLVTLSSRNKTKHDNDCGDNLLYKKRKSVTGHSENELNKADKLPRCSSEAMIISALDSYDVDNIIGDFSKPYCLPTIVGSHCDLKCITPDTLAQVIEGQYNDVVERFIIIDCRYPYEFEGGHIKNAVNIWEKGSMIKFQKSAVKPKLSNKRSIIIFHCEFSSERAPKMSRFLREIDRAANKECYPSLGFPELYTLEGGYKAFYAEHKELCEPQMYKPMLHENHIQDLRHFRAKSKSWAGERESKTSFRSNKLTSF